MTQQTPPASTAGPPASVQSTPPLVSQSPQPTSITSPAPVSTPVGSSWSNMTSYSAPVASNPTPIIQGPASPNMVHHQSAYGSKMLLPGMMMQQQIPSPLSQQSQMRALIPGQMYDSQPSIIASHNPPIYGHPLGDSSLATLRSKACEHAAARSLMPSYK